ncbi:unnamed protein product [Bursaphelenchus okinawaensis]|uniref:Uncharacterized protein n=1 Tax=Bursaphelenchus okinawaensis TaxID=465554 RepID=A0A811JTC1_9BILA|nr:unnamed protein product [Bursaphelenchus okinawaensis]CAG9082121.1 unnamed protein product [Bursaphelenchus okinawaensis]
MRAYIQHRQRVMDIGPRVDARRSQSVTHSNFNSFKTLEEARRIQLENARLLNKIIRISRRKTEFGFTTKRSSSGASSRQTSSSNSSMSTSTYSSNR